MGGWRFTESLPTQVTTGFLADDGTIIGGTIGPVIPGYWDIATFFLNDSGGGGGSTVRATPKLKFKPPSWGNFIQEFLPCYGNELLYNLVGDDGKAAVTTGTAVLTVGIPLIGGPLWALWTGSNAFKAGAACAFASRAVYE